MEELEMNTSTREEKPLNYVYNSSELKQWMYERVKHYIKENVLEIGATTDNLSGICSHCNAYILSQFLLNEYEIENMHPDLLYHFETIIILNPTTTFSLNSKLLSNCHKLLKNEGHLIFYTATRTGIYNFLNASILPWDHYNRQYVRNNLPDCFKLVKTRYFNLYTEENKVINNQNTPSLFYKMVRQFKNIKHQSIIEEGLFIITVSKK